MRGVAVLIFSVLALGGVQDILRKALVAGLGCAARAYAARLQGLGANGDTLLRDTCHSSQGHGRAQRQRRRHPRMVACCRGQGMPGRLSRHPRNCAHLLNSTRAQRARASRSTASTLP